MDSTKPHQQITNVQGPMHIEKALELVWVVVRMHVLVAVYLFFVFLSLLHQDQ